MRKSRPDASKVNEGTVPHRPGTPEQVKCFYDAYLPWQNLYHELGERGVEYEDRKVEVANVHSRWLALFGEDKIAVEQVFHLLGEHQYANDLLERDPSLTTEQLQAEVHRRCSATDRTMRPLLRDVLLARERQFYPDRPCDWDDTQWAQAQAHKKKVFREAWRLLHPDVLQHNPRYACLSDEQKDLVHRFQCTLSAVRSQDTGFAPEQLGFSFKSPQSMQHTLFMIKEMLGNPDIAIDFERMIPGTTITEQTAWLIEDQERLRRGLEELDTALIALLSDDSYQEERWQIACPEQEDTIRERLREQAASYSRQAEQVRQEVSKLLGEEWEWDCDRVHEP